MFQLTVHPSASIRKEVFLCLWKSPPMQSIHAQAVFGLTSPVFEKDLFI